MQKFREKVDVTLISELGSDINGIYKKTTFNDFIFK